MDLTFLNNSSPVSQMLDRATQRALWARIESLVNREVPPALWPDAELYAFADAHCQDLQHLTDEELEAIDG